MGLGSGGRDMDTTSEDDERIWMDSGCIAWRWDIPMSQGKRE